MHLAIDASRATLARRTGTENYALQLIRAVIGAARPEDRLTLYFRDAPAPNLLPDSPNVTQRILPARRGWTHTRFAAAASRDKPDFIFVPAHTLPFIFRGHAAVTVHDLGYRFFPQAHPLKERLYLELTTRFSAWRANIVFADSEATKRDLMAQYGTPAHKIEVVYPGVADIRRASPDEIRTVREKYRLPERYVLFLGTLQPRKNIARLCAAFAEYLAQSGDSELALCLAGQSGWLLNVERDILPQLPEAARQRIITTGYVADSEVAPLYSGAACLAFPSLYEGFGFPVVEAMRCGTPVVCSGTSSLAELAGDAAITVNPMEVAAIRDGIGRVLGDLALREALIQRGYLQSAKFTWENAATSVLSAFRAALKANPRTR